jgi:cytoskeletal protein CcmA (bactofilin family)
MFKKSKETAPPRPRPTSKGPSVLGPTLTFKGGELSADEDLIIEGTVEGTIAHQSHSLTIGKHGRVKADVRARVITVQGTIQGDLHGDEAVYITSTGRVSGNVLSPRVAIEDGASFSGSINTTSKPALTATSVREQSGSGAVANMAGSVGVFARRDQDPEHAETG